MKRLGAGRTAEVFLLPDGRACKLFFPFVPPSWIAAEERAALCAGRLHLPAPRCHGRIEREGRVGLLFDRVEGENLLARLLRGDMDPAEAGARLAALHASLLRRSAPEDLPDLAARLQAQIARAPLPEDERRSALAALLALPRGEALCHGDLHPDNIVCAPQGLVALDFANAARGEARLDIARTLFLLEEAPLPPGAPAAEGLRRALAERYLSAMGMTRAELALYLRVVRAARAGENSAALSG